MTNRFAALADNELTLGECSSKVPRCIEPVAIAGWRLIVAFAVNSAFNPSSWFVVERVGSLCSTNSGDRRECQEVRDRASAEMWLCRPAESVRCPEICLHILLTFSSRLPLCRGATCYLNSLIQSLYMTPDFRRALFSLTDEDVNLKMVLWVARSRNGRAFCSCECCDGAAWQEDRGQG